MTVYDRIERPLTAAELAENERLIAEWEALTAKLMDLRILWIDEYDITRPTAHVDFVPVEGPEEKPDNGIIRMVPVRSPFRRRIS